jgi:hypothetical protein
VVAVRRRTTVRWAGVLVLLGGLTGCGSSSSVPVSTPPPAHHTKTTRTITTRTITGRDRTTRDRTGTARIVSDPDARLGAFSVIPGHPGRRAATWYVCRDARCDHRTSAAVVTTDGFGDRTVVDLPPSRNYFGYAFQPAGPDHFVVTVNAGHPRLIDLHGHVQDIHVGGTTSPIARGEVAVGGKALRHWLALDPDTGSAHPLSTPRDTVEVQTQPSGQLRALTLHFGYFWSDDGGGSWHHVQLPPGDRRLMVGMIPTTGDSVQALQLGGDGATGFPWDHVLRSTDDRTWTSYDGPDDPQGYGDPVAVLPDGRLLLDIDGWSDWRKNHPPEHPLGLYTGADWAHLQPVPFTGPFARQDPHAFGLSIFDVAVTTQSVTVYAQTPDQSGVVSSTDGGGTWKRVRAR